MSFLSSKAIPKTEIFPGGMSGLVAGQNLMMSFLDMADGAQIPSHSHPHEQAGIVLAGRLRLRIGDEERVLGTGEAFLIPPNVEHSGAVMEGPVRVLDVFSPVREDYLGLINPD